MTQEPGQQGPGQPDPGQQGPWSATPPTQPVAGGADPWHQPPAEPDRQQPGRQQPDHQEPAEPDRQQPEHQKPAEPAYQQPAYQQPAYQQPAQQQPGQQQPGQQQPTYQQPGYQQPGHQQPRPSTGSTLTLPPTPVLVRIAQLAAPVLLLIALVIPLDESMPLRSHTLWALWALAGAVLQALPAIGVGGTVEKRWTLAAVGAGALALYWLLVTLPSVATSGGFLVTLATACAVAGVLLSPGRRL